MFRKAIVTSTSALVALTLAACTSRAPRVEVESEGGVPIDWMSQREDALAAREVRDAQQAGSPQRGSIPAGAKASASPKDELSRLSLEELEGEIDRRLAAERAKLATASDPSLIESHVDTMAQRVDEKLGALHYLQDGRSPESLAYQALEAIRAEDDAGVESKLVAAAVLGNSGLDEDRDQLVAEVYREIFPQSGGAAGVGGGGPGEPARSTGRRERGSGNEGTWTADRETFEPATSTEGESGVSPGIAPASQAGSESDLPSMERLDNEGPGAPAEPIPNGVFQIQSIVFQGVDKSGVFQPGAVCSLAGNFVGFAEHFELYEEVASYRSTFTASLHLLDGGGAPIDFGYFLDRAVSTASEPRSELRFWAECTLPSELEPGEYRLRVEAVDHESGESARAEIPLRVARK